MLNILYKVYSFCIALPIFIVITIFVSTSVIIAGFLGDANFVAYYLPKFWSKCAFWLFLLRVKVEGRENIKKDESYVFLANHQGYYDIFLAYGYLGHNFKWMMKEYLKKIPFVGYACVKSKHIYLADGISGIAKAVQQARETLRGGMSMIIFPEGTRTYTGKMSPFKRGSFMLANEIGLPIVPLTINGSFDAFSRKAKSVSRGTVTLTIHKPITAEERKGKATKVIMQEVYDIINGALVEKYRDVPSPSLSAPSATPSLSPSATPSLSEPSATSRLKAALFDLDGTLIDTEGQYSTFWSAIGRRFRPDVPTLANDIKGTTLTNIYATYFPDPDVQKTITEELNAWEAQMKYEFLPGATEFIQDLKRHGVKCALVTSSNTLKIESVIRQIPDFNTLFDKVLTAEDFTASKPAPDCYLLGAKTFSAATSECVVFEDAYTGLQAGMSSGILTIGLATSHSPEEIKDKCHYVLDGFSGMTYNKLIDIIGNTGKDRGVAK